MAKLRKNDASVENMAIAVANVTYRAFAGHRAS